MIWARLIWLWSRDVGFYARKRRSLRTTILCTIRIFPRGCGRRKHPTTDQMPTSYLYIPQNCLSYLRKFARGGSICRLILWKHVVLLQLYAIPPSRLRIKVPSRQVLSSPVGMIKTQLSISLHSRRSELTSPIASCPKSHFLIFSSAIGPPCASKGHPSSLSIETPAMTASRAS